MTRRPFILAFVLSVILSCALVWPLPLGLGTHFTPSAYGATHAWTADHLLQSILHGTDPHSLSSLGYPWIREAQFIGWAPTVASWPLRLVLGPLAAFQLIVLLSLPFSALLAGKFIQRIGDCSPAIAAPAGILFAFSPYALATLQTGEAPKLQLWLLPLFGLALFAAKKLRWRSTLALAAVACLTSFTSPYYGLAFPLLAIFLALYRLRQKQIEAAISSVSGCAIGLLPALFYYRNPAQASDSFYRPALAAPPMEHTLPTPHPVASVQDLILGMTDNRTGGWDTAHECALGLTLILAAFWFFWRTRKVHRPGRSFGVALTLFGVILAMGPTLVWTNQHTAIPLPAALLEALHYPLQTGGMYYRMVPFASLGLALILAVSLGKNKRGLLLIWGIVGLQCADAIRHTGPWPRPVHPLPSMGFFNSIQGEDGAVLAVPIVASRAPGSAQKALLRQLHHQRPETALPSDMHSTEIHALQALLTTALNSQDPSAALRKQGFRYVLYQPEQNNLDHRWERDQLIQSLGAPSKQSGFLIWDLGPTTLSPRRFPAAR
jgi:hypothetical protein